MEYNNPYCVSKIAPDEVLNDPVEIHNPRPRLRTMCTLEEYTADRQRFEDELMDRAETRKERWDRRGWGSGSPNIWECVLAEWYDVYEYEADSVLHEMILVDIFHYVLSNHWVEGGWDSYWQEGFDFLHDRTGWSREYQSLWVHLTDDWSPRWHDARSGRYGD